MKWMIVCLLVLSCVAVSGTEAGAETTTCSHVSAVQAAKAIPKQVIDAKTLECVKDPKRDFNFFNGQEPGRDDAFVDITGAATARVILNGGRPAADFIEEFQCGTGTKSLVVCSPAGAALVQNEPYLVFGMQLAGKARREAPPGETTRYQLFLHADGDPATVVAPNPQGPNQSSVGSNLTYQVVFGDPGTTEQPSLQLLAVDNRTPQQFLSDSQARVLIRGSTVLFVVPERETGIVDGLRGAAFSGSRTTPGDATLGNQDVVPGKTDGTKWKLLLPPWRPAPAGS